MRKCKCGKRANYLKRNKKWLCDDCAKEQGYLVKCHGEAHKNPYADNCMICAPRWELVEVLRKEA